MRLAALAMAAAIPGLAAAQAGLAGSLSQLARALKPHAPITTQGAKPPGQALQPTGFPGLSEKDKSLPAPQPEGTQRLRIVGPEDVHFERQGDIVRVTNGVHAQYRGYDLYGDKLDGNLATNIFTLSGHAKLVGVNAIVEGDWIEIDFDNETFRSGEAYAQVRPEFLKGYLTDDLYLWGREADGSRREVHTHDGGLTTCNLDEPHFRLLARSITTRPNKRVILRDTAVEVLGRTIIRLPYLSIPLDTRREQYTPEVGQSQIEGYYIKTRWGIPLSSDNNDLNAYLDYFEKLGAGYGGRLAYSGGRYDGYFRAYALSGQQNSLELISEHQQLFGNSLLLLSNNYQRSNFFNAPDNTTLNTRASLSIPQRGATTRLTYLRHTNESTGFSSFNQTWGVSDQRSWGPDTRTNLDVRWAQNASQSSLSTVEREQIDVRFKGQHDFEKGIAELEYVRAIPVGETTNFFGSSDRTPVLALRTDSRRLFGPSFERLFRFNTELSVGEFANPAAQDRVTRTYFDLNFVRPDTGRQRTGLTLNGRFRQGMYSDDTAQYAVDVNTAFRYSLGTNVGLNIRHSYLMPKGFTPLAIDRIGKKNFLSSDLSFRLGRTLLLGAQTGYDFRLQDDPIQSPWQQVGVRLEWVPKDWIQFRALPTYDPTLKKWSNFRFDLAWAAGATFINLGARYDGIRNTWGQVNAFVDGLKWGRTKLTGLAAYNGYLKRFESTQYSLIYDLHCWEAVLRVVDNTVGFRAGRQIYFFFRLKAFPIDTNFGTGTRGQPIGTGTGFGF